MTQAQQVAKATSEANSTHLIPLCHIVTPVGCLGYGLDYDICDDELARLAKTSLPTAIILDSGSTDSGPTKLAFGSMSCPRASYKRDLTKLLAMVHKYNVPLLFSSTGGDGTDAHVDEIAGVVREINESKGGSNRQTKIVKVYSGIDKTTIKERLAAGKITGCGSAVPTLTSDDIESAPRIVAQMGPEPFLDVLRAHPDANVIVGGRAYDPAPYVAYAAYHALAGKKTPLQSLGSEILGGFFHMGKILECGAQCAVPKGTSARTTVYADGTFDVVPLEPGARCTPRSVAAHTLYEKARPDFLAGPGGVLDLREATYEQLADQKTVRAGRGSLFHTLATEGKPYTVKLEGARSRGYRTMFIGVFRDPILTVQVDSVFDRIRAYVAAQHQHIGEKWELILHKFGATDPHAPGEVFVVGEALAPTQEIATSLANTARVGCIHAPYPGQKATSGNFGFGIGGPMDIEVGLCAEFCVYHLMDLADGEEGASERSADGGKPSGVMFSFSTMFSGERATGFPTDFHEPKEQKDPSKPKTPVRPSISSDDFRLPAHITTLGDVSPILRSKNAGPYEITLDILFSNHNIYTSIKNSGLLTKETIAQLYSLKPEQVIYCGFFDQAWAFKATMPRITNGKISVSGNFGEEDVHGSQQYLPLMGLKLPANLVEKLNKKAVL
ncbi:hypothetical protein CC78DRAFT_47406 [Lojkania enalia]|uniref:Caib baif family enzyme n=1 Tax=Lojkania enalia TaxID=147567 RepID=A0A9P4N2X9_9PLEO|nr:hypothetical protein CC78DRAFT_47406 [Didymosphaeria enalia]